MSEHFSRIPIERLLSWVLKEYSNGSIFGIDRSLFFQAPNHPNLRMQRFGQLLETPLGVAAGPHSQMAQNIVTSWVLGARFIELKTIQTLDKLTISKPCIDMEDEGYNCEWSQELTCADSFDEYLNAWIIIHVLKHLWGWKEPEPGFIFNMSVGYDMKGILQENVQFFLRKMKDASAEKKEKIDRLSSIYPGIKSISIPDCISDNVTLSTMHGCPPQEIEKIAQYLMEEKGLHTSVKLNPTLLGPEPLRELLNDLHRFPVQIPDEAFQHDLKFKDAVGMIERLTEVSNQKSLTFGLKLTNTLESHNQKDRFPKKETMAYLSGRALHPISIHVAAKLQNHFSGSLDLSFSGGADCFNVRDIIASGLKPVTICSDLLKPGGYARLTQYIEHLAPWDEIEENLKRNTVSNTQHEHLNRYAKRVRTHESYTKTPYSWFNIKTERQLNSFDCISAPCVSSCPSSQEIPQYMRAVAAGDFDEAHAIIMRSNPFPGVTGLVCDHSCQSKCTRQNYDAPLQIREIKRAAERRHVREDYDVPHEKKPGKVAIIGAGPSGLSAAYILCLNGFSVEIFEAKKQAGGMVSGAIPMFRLTEDAMDRDMERVLRLGAEIFFNHPVDSIEFKRLQAKYSMVYISIGASVAKKLGLKGEEANGVYDQIQFLEALRASKPLELGRKVIIIGGGNSAIDAARSVSRLVPEGGEVVVVYRRTRKEMPAEIEEIEALSSEGVRVKELTAPLEILTKDGQVCGIRCQSMKLGALDSSGRRRPIPIAGSEWDMEVDCVISAIGQDVALDFTTIQNVNPETLETDQEGVFMGGDAHRGASTIIQAVADGIQAANGMIQKAGYQPKPQFVDAGNQAPSPMQPMHAAHRNFPVLPNELPLNDRKNFKLVRDDMTSQEAMAEAERCLSCDLICDVCVTVCPNRANISYQISPLDMQIPKIKKANDGYEVTSFEAFQLKQQHQVLNIGDFCNECGNCTTFCPTSGNPFIDKPKFYLTRKSFEAESSGYYLTRNALEARVEGITERLTETKEGFHYERPEVSIVFSKDTFEIVTCQWHTETQGEISLLKSAELKTLFISLKDQGFSSDL